MQIQGMFAVASVSDIEAAIDWYSKLMGRAPDQRPMDDLAQWMDGTTGLQLRTDAWNAGHSLVTIVTPDIAAARRALEAEALELGPESRGDYGAVAEITDPDGNRLTLAEPPRQ
ncbi:MAG: VOC family protein [Bauldia sp.]